jgi:hypothetical protein
VTDSVANQDTYSKEEMACRRDAALRRALNATPQLKHGQVKEVESWQKYQTDLKRDPGGGRIWSE